MKGIAPLLVFALLAVSIAGILYFTGAGLVGKASLVTINGDTCSLIRPLFGRYECATANPIHQQIATWTGDLKNGQLIVQCDVNAPSCQLSVKCDYGSSLTGGTFFYYQADSSSCTIGGSSWCVTGVSPNAESASFIILNKGQRLRAASCSSSLGGAWPGTLYETATPYVLYKYDKGAFKSIANGQLCTIADTSKVLKDCGDAKTSSGPIACINTAGSTSLGKVLTADGNLVYGDWVNYLDFYVDVPSIGNLQDYNGQKVLCESNGGQTDLWSLGKFSTEGACYFIEKSKIATVDCCPGQNYPGYTCQNFKWISTASPNVTVQCYSSLECTDAGGVYLIGSEKYQESCTGGKCVNNDLGAAGCTASSQCQPGYICNLQTYQCDRSIPNVLCGDGICSDPYENEASCPTDCKNGFLNNIYSFLSWAVIGVIISAVLIGVLVIFTPLKLLVSRGWKMLIASIILLGLGIGLLLMWVLG